jgi:D-alanyl-D-alanine carboxypeptidase/D-alanyl-D-alanine-endopeptidase (penicillin-binding protein 4)
MIRIIWVIILCLCISSLQAQRYKRRQIKKDLTELSGFENAFIGFALYDPEGNKMLASHYADKQMTPASITKLFTYWSAQRTLPETLPALEYTIQGDSLIFWSTGYPLTLHPDHPDSTVIHFLAQQDKKLYYWPRTMVDDRYGPGWGWDDYVGYYGAEKSVFPIYGNSIEFIIDNANQQFNSTPEYWGFKIKESNFLSNRARVNRDEFWNEFEIQYDSTVDLESPVDTLIRPFRYNDQLFVELLNQASGKSIQKIEIFDRPKHHETLYGVSADSLYKWMLQPSDNLFAESLLLMASGQRSDTLNTGAQIDFENDSISSRSYPYTQAALTWVDGSGLSRYNMFTPNQMITVLHALYLTHEEDKLLELMPAGGVSGTIEDWYAGENGQPYVFAKTGTLSNNHTLSGYIQTKKGKTLIFTIMANHYTCPTDQIKENFGVILEKIREGY